ncbi:MAG: glucose-6-phosphate isomerase [Limnochordia bacterium]
MIKLDYTKALSFIDEREIGYYQGRINTVHRWLHEGGGPGEDYLGWVDLPRTQREEEVESIEDTAAKLRAKADVFVLIGIGGSYLGARAAIEMLSHSFHNELALAMGGYPAVYYAGHNASGTYLAHLLEFLADKEVCLNVVSKSGTTTEPAIAFRFLKEFMEKRYGKKEARERILVTTDAHKGALKTLADEEGYRSFVIPDDIGGRYSVLTPVGLVPMAVAGIDIRRVLAGAAKAYEAVAKADLSQNDAYLYAVLRQILYKQGYGIELLVSYEPRLHYLAEWWKQLFGESEGKGHKGLFPAACDFTTDLHSLGQYIQEGRRFLFETVLRVEQPDGKLQIKAMPQDTDGLNYLAGQGIDLVNEKALQGTLLAHIAGHVPNLVLEIPRLTEEYFGALVYFLEKACGASGYLLGVNPFDQPGVEAYKKNMFALLGKPGYEAWSAHLTHRLTGAEEGKT